MPAGSPRPTAGRPKGGHNRKTIDAVAKAEAGGQTPLEYLLADMRDPSLDRTERRDAAKAAAPYCHARLTSVEAKVEGELAHTIKSIERIVIDTVADIHA